MMTTAKEGENAARQALDLKQERLSKLRAEPNLRRLADSIRELRERIDELRQVSLSFLLSLRRVYEQPMCRA